MISALACIPRGAAKARPVKDAPDEAELRELKEQALAAGGLEDMEDGSDDQDDEGGSDAEELVDADGAAGNDVEAAVQHARAVAASMSTQSAKPSGGATSVEEAFRQLDMDNYDQEPDDLVSRLLQGSKIEHDGEDRYITPGMDDTAIAPEDVEADEIRPTDLLVAAVKAEEDAAGLEVWLFEEPDADGERTAYVHHDIPLPSFPLAVAWMRFNPTDPATPGNLAAVGTMEPEIEVWDLDTIDVLEPAAVLGGYSRKDAARKPSRSDDAAKRKFRKGSHKSSVLALAWNPQIQNVLASGSADKTIKVWDLAAGSCELTLKHHTDKVQALAWNPAEPSGLLSGAFGGAACVCDARAGDAAVAAWSIGTDVESLAWNPHAPTKFVVSGDDGHVYCFDTRAGAGCAALWTLGAHSEAVTAVAFSPAAVGLLVTASVDKAVFAAGDENAFMPVLHRQVLMVKVWSTKDDKPKMLVSQDVQVGAVLSLGIPHDDPQAVVAGGAKGEISVWDMKNVPELRRLF